MWIQMWFAGSVLCVLGLCYLGWRHWRLTRGDQGIPAEEDMVDAVVMIIPGLTDLPEVTKGRLMNNLEMAIKLFLIEEKRLTGEQSNVEVGFLRGDGSVQLSKPRWG